jgi:hypothetical protein
MRPFLFAVLFLCVTALCGVTASFPSLERATAALVERERPEGGEEAETDGPDLAYAWRRLAWLDENGRIPAGAWARAIAQREKLVGPAALVPGDSWFQRGPDDVAGRSRCLVIHPSQPQVMWLGSAGGGVWKTTDGGNTWLPKSERLGSLAVSALAINPQNPDVLYAGTGEGYFNGDALMGVGMYKSTDAGETWTLLAGTSGMGDINKIAVSPADPNLILAGTTSFAGAGGIWRSTNAGGTWSHVKTVHRGHSIEFLPLSPSVVLGSIADYNFNTGADNATALYSTDGGATWSNSNLALAINFPARLEVAPAPGDVNVAYANVNGEIYKSTDKGVSYTLVGNVGDANQGWYNNDIWVDPTNANRIVVAAVYVYRSSNGGSSFNRIGQGYIQTDQPHPDCHAIVADPGYDGSSNKTVYVCTDGGVYRASDITTASTGSGWTRLDRGARVTQYYGVAGDGPTGKIIGGTQDNGTLRILPGSDNAVMTFGGDGGWVAIDPTDPTYSYGEYVFLRVHRNTGGTGPNGSEFIYNGLSDAFNGQANFIAPFILDPNRPQVMLAGGWRLWRCDDLKAGTPTFVQIRAGGSDYISAIAVAPGNSDIIYVAQNDGQVYKTTNGTAATPTWTAIDDNGAKNPFPNRYVTRILVDPADAQKVFVCLGGFSSNNLWMSTNGGSTWAVRTGSGGGVLPQVPIRTIARKPDDANVLHVGTEVGVFSSADGGVTWGTTNDAPANVSVDELRYMNNSTTLLAGTHGRGIWQLQRVSLLKSLTLAVPSIYGGLSTTGTVTLGSPAGAGGVSVALDSSDPAVTVPASVTVASGSSSANFAVNTSPVTTSTTATIEATVSGSSLTADLQVLPAALGGVSLSPTEVSATSPSRGTVTLTSPAPAGGIAVTLKSSSTAAATVPGTVTVPEGSSSVEFNVNTKPVSAVTTVDITASYGGSTFSAALKIQPVTLSSLTISPTATVGGTTASKPVAKVTLAAAPVTDVAFTVKSSLTSAASNVLVTVPAGSLSGTAEVTTKPVDAETIVTFTATHGAVSKTATLRVRTAALLAFLRNVSSVVGGSSNVLTGTVTLSGPAGPSGKVVSLASDNTAVTVPASVTVPANVTSFKVTLQHARVPSQTLVTVSATLGATTKSLAVTLYSFLKKIAVSPTSVVGGANSKGTVYLAALAPAGGLDIALASSSASATVPASVTVAAGASSASFTIATTPVATDQAATITATLDATNVTAALTVKPPALSSVKLNTTSVKGGSTTSVRLTVNLNGAAPAGGTTVALSSSNELVATLPPSVLIPAGAKTASVAVTHKAVVLQMDVTLTATQGSINKSAVLTVNP